MQHQLIRSKFELYVNGAKFQSVKSFSSVFSLLMIYLKSVGIYLKLWVQKFLPFNQQVEKTKLQQKIDEREVSLKQSAQARVNFRMVNIQMQHQLISIMPQI